MAGYYTAKNLFFLRNTMVLYSIGGFSALLRIGIRFHLTRRLGPEEYLMFFALLCWTGDTFLITAVVEKGTNQVGPYRDRKTIPPDELARREVGSKCFLAAWFLYTTAIWACKAAILIFYKRLTERVMQRKAIRVAAVVLAVSYGVCMLSIALVCRPFENNWKVYPDPGAACTEGRQFVWIVGIFNIVTDLMLMAIPMPLLLHLQVSLARKILLGVLFGLGIFVVVATVLRIYFTISSRNIANMTFWSMIETATMFVVCNAPGIKSIFNRNPPKSSSAGAQSGRSYEMGLSNRAHAKHTQKVMVTTQIGAGDSQERIIGAGSSSGEMVIRRDVSYDVVEERTASPEGVAPSVVGIAAYSAKCKGGSEV